MLLNNYLEQHQSIRDEVCVISSLTNKGNLEENAFEIASHISRLAGIINIHLNSEDKFLYPKLEKSEDKKVCMIANEYQKEMGDLLAVFLSFKDKYNTKAKLIQNSTSFKQEFKDIIDALEKRMKKEESGLYPFI